MPPDFFGKKVGGEGMGRVGRKRKRERERGVGKEWERQERKQNKGGEDGEGQVGNKIVSGVEKREANLRAIGLQVHQRIQCVHLGTVM